MYSGIVGGSFCEPMGWGLGFLTANRGAEFREGRLVLGLGCSAYPCSSQTIYRLVVLGDSSGRFSKYMWCGAGQSFAASFHIWSKQGAESCWSKKVVGEERPVGTRSASTCPVTFLCWS